MELDTEQIALHNADEVSRILAILLRAVAAFGAVTFAPIPAALAARARHAMQRVDQPFGVAHTRPCQAFQMPDAPHGGHVHAIGMREFPGLVLFRFGGDAGGHASVVETGFVLQLGPERGLLRGCCQAEGERAPVGVGVTVAADEPTLRVKVFGEAILTPEARDEVMADAFGELVEAYGVRRVADDAVERGGAAEGVHGVRLRNAVAFEAQRPFDVISSAANSAIGRYERCQLTSGAVHRINARGEPITIERAPENDVGVLYVSGCGERGQRVARNPMPVQAAVRVHGRLVAFGPDWFPGQLRQHGDGQRTVGALK